MTTKAVSDLPAAKARATLVIPCLNEEATLGPLLEECRRTFEGDGTFDWQILVADNGSRDDSVRIARENRAEVIHVLRKGYGAALDAGIRAASSEWVVYLDADGTYRPADALALARHAVGSELELVVGNRLRGVIEPGAMPELHRRLGTPVLSSLIRLLAGSSIGDCNSGIRAVRVSSYLGWHVRSTGMEFASELLLKAALHGARTDEIPADLRKGPPGRTPHLRTWRDGMRHLLVILCAAPRLFWNAGLGLLAASLMMQVPAVMVGEIKILGKAVIFGPHTQALAVLVGVAGAALTNVGLVLYGGAGRTGRKPMLARLLTETSEERLFWFLAGAAVLFSGGLGWVFWHWARAEYSNFHFLRAALGVVHLGSVAVSIVIGVLQCHIQKRSTVFER